MKRLNLIEGVISFWLAELKYFWELVKMGSICVIINSFRLRYSSSGFINPLYTRESIIVAFIASMSSDVSSLFSIYSRMCHPL